MLPFRSLLFHSHREEKGGRKERQEDLSRAGWGDRGENQGGTAELGLCLSSSGRHVGWPGPGGAQNSEPKPAGSMVCPLQPGSDLIKHRHNLFCV